MIHSKLSLTLLAMAATLVGASSLKAQYTYLLTEAPAIIQYSLSVPSVGLPTNSGSDHVIRTRPVSVPFTPKNFLEELVRSNLITGDVANWSVVAVRPAPSDVYYVDTRYFFYAVRKSGGVIVERVQIPTDKFSFTPNLGNFVYTERYQGNYTLDAKGSTLNYVDVAYRPNFLQASTSTVYDLVAQESQPTAGILSWANANIAFVNVDEPVFYIAPTSVRISGVGGLSGQRGPVAGPFTPVQGLVTFTITIGAPRLVDANDYPAVSTNNQTVRSDLDIDFFTGQ